MIESYLSEKQLAERLNLSLACLRKWRYDKTGPKYVKFGKCVRYSAADLDEWLASRATGGER